MADVKKAVGLIQKALALLGAGGGDDEQQAISMPEPAEVEKLKAKALTKLAAQFGIETDDVEDEDTLRAITVLLSQIVHDEVDTDELDSDVVEALCAATGVTPSKKVSKTLEALKEFADAAVDSTDGEAEEEEEGEEEEGEEEEGEEGEAEDESEDEEDDEPKKKKGKKSKSSDDDDDDAGDEEEGEESEEEGEEEEGDEESEEPEITEAHLKKFNAKSAKKAKNLVALKKLLTDDDGTLHAWGEPYVKEETAWCCGAELEDTGKKKGGNAIGRCQITGKRFVQNDDGELVALD